MAVKGTKLAVKVLDTYMKGFRKWLLKDLTKNSILLASHTKERYLRGGTSNTRLRKRSSKLEKSTTPIKAKLIPGGIKAGIKFGTVYAKVHIGKKGTVTTIRPKKGKYLAIPLDTAKTAKGASRGSPKNKTLFGSTFVAKSKAGNLIIFGKSVYQKGKRAGEEHGKLVPLFVLKRQVKIPVRVDTGALIKWIEPKLIKDIEKTAKKVISLHKGALN